jgi:hypothetical protein
MRYRDIDSTIKERDTVEINGINRAVLNRLIVKDAKPKRRTIAAQPRESTEPQSPQELIAADIRDITRLIYQVLEKLKDLIGKVL